MLTAERSVMPLCVGLAPRTASQPLIHAELLSCLLCCFRAIKSSCRSLPNARLLPLLPVHGSSLLLVLCDDQSKQWLKNDFGLELHCIACRHCLRDLERVSVPALHVVSCANLYPFLHQFESTRRRLLAFDSLETEVNLLLPLLSPSFNCLLPRLPS